MVFCCIAIVALAIFYFIGLWIRQMFSWPRPDKRASNLPAPPRALSGNGALPVYGHTRIFAKRAGDVALLFPPNWNELQCLPKSCSRQLGDCFAIFIWGEWRIVVKGPERARKVMNAMTLKEGWPWTPPVTLLGKSCFDFMEEDEVDQMRRLIERPLDHRVILSYAHIFAEIAEKCIDDICNGVFSKRKGTPKSSSQLNRSTDGPTPRENDIHRDEDDFTLGADQARVSQLKWEALRSYTFDLIDGPILSMNYWRHTSEQILEEATGESTAGQTKTEDDNDELPSREEMLLWMERIKSGVDVIKLTFGPEWMGIWKMNEYGRALNARTNLEEIIHKHVQKMTEKVPVHHEIGHLYHDPTTRTIPLLSLRDNLIRNREGILGVQDKKPNLHIRPRSRSTPLVCTGDSNSDDELFESIGEYVTPHDMEQDLARPKYEMSPALKKLKRQDINLPNRPTESPTRKSFRDQTDPPKVTLEIPNKKDPRDVMPLLERILRQQDLDGNGISMSVTTELSILLWLIMDTGNAWTAMTLKLLSSNREACCHVQQELDLLLLEHGQEALFTPEILNKMPYLDAALYEAIRLCPANLGGMKVTTETIELEDVGVQIPKDSNIIFCQPTDMNFDINKAYGKKPERLGKRYPRVELHGFLPLQGLEVPLMVLQSKVFLITVLLKYSPCLSKKKTFIRKVKEAASHLNASFMGIKTITSDDAVSDGFEVIQEDPFTKHGSTPSDLEEGQCCEISQSEAMRLFTKIPFPEPKRVIHLRPRSLD